MGPGPAGIPQLEYLFSRIVCTSVPLGFIALLVILVIAGIKYLVSGGEPKAISSAHQTVTWGLLGVLFLAISWLILQLIQNFTGIEVTKFTLASLPGIEGFTGSCWASAPTSTAKKNITPTGTKEVSEFSFPVKKIMVTCDNPFDRMDPIATPGWTTAQGGFLPAIPVLSNLVYLNSPLDEPGFRDTVDRVTNLNILSAGAVEDIVWFQKPYGGNGVGIREFLISLPDHLDIPGIWELARSGKDYILGKFEKDKIPVELVNTQHESLQLLRKFWERGDSIFSESGSRLFGYKSAEDFNTVILLGYSCTDADFYVINTTTPLIYFYPKQTIKIQVQIKSPIISPVKNWSFIVSPEGKIALQDGKKLNFIPYEFLRRDFRRPDRGLVLNSENLVNYLKDNLWKSLGLTDVEREDYWQDIGWRIPKSPYYFVSLIDRSEIDRVLPMEVSPKPDTIIRNMTYILPLSQPFIPVPLPEIKAPQRKGFTVLENGGFIDGF